MLSLLLLSGCDLQSPWSREYHLRQFEKWRTLGDRARVSDNAKTAVPYYQKAIDELRQAGSNPVKEAQAIQDIAECDLMDNDLQGALHNFESAQAIYQKQAKLSALQKFAQLRCLTGTGVVLLKMNQVEKAEAILKQVASTTPVLKNSEQAIACGWPPLLCQHAAKYWLAVCHEKTAMPAVAPEKNRSNETDLATLLADPTICQPVREMLADQYSDRMYADSNFLVANQVDAKYGIARNADSSAAEELQRRWEALSKQGKKCEEEGNFAGAIECFTNALQIARAAKPASLTREVTSLCNLAYFYLNNNALASAVPLLKECVDIQRSRFGDNDRGLTMPLARLGRTLFTLGDTKNAAPLLTQGYDLAVKGYGAESQFTARVECMLAELQAKENHLEEAEIHVNHALPIMQRDLMRNERGIIDGELLLADIYKMTGRGAQCMKQSIDAADFAQEYGSYRDQIFALDNLFRLSQQQKNVAVFKDAIRREKEVFDDAMANPKWSKWAKIKKRKLQSETGVVIR